MFSADHASDAASPRWVSSRGLNMKHSKARPAGSWNSTRTTVWKPCASHSMRQRLDVSWSDFAMCCHATRGASESRHGAPKSRLSASACAASATRGGCPATTSRSSLRPNGLGPSTATASTENSPSAPTQSLSRPSRLTLSKLTGSCIDVFWKNRDNSTHLRTSREDEPLERVRDSRIAIPAAAPHRPALSHLVLRWLREEVVTAPLVPVLHPSPLRMKGLGLFTLFGHPLFWFVW